MISFLKIDQRKNEAVYLYEQKGLTMKDVAKKFDCSAETVRRRFTEWNLKIKPTALFHKGRSKSFAHAEKLRDNLNKQRPKAVRASKKLWNHFNGQIITRKEFLAKMRVKAMEARKKISYVGSKNPKWRGGTSDQYFKQVILARDGRVCQVCGYNAHPEVIEVHHKDGNHGNNALDNGMAICPTCHRVKEFEAKTFHTALRNKRYG